MEKQFVALDIYCEPCRGRGKECRLARFLRATWEGAEPVIQVEAWRVGGVAYTPAWSFGPDGVEKAKLECGCGHKPVVARSVVERAVDAIPQDSQRRGTLRHYL